MKNYVLCLGGGCSYFNCIWNGGEQRAFGWGKLMCAHVPVWCNILIKKTCSPRESEEAGKKKEKGFYGLVDIPPHACHECIGTLSRYGSRKIVRVFSLLEYGVQQPSWNLAACFIAGEIGRR